MAGKFSDMTQDDIAKSTGSVTKTFVEAGFKAANIAVSFAEGTKRRSRRGTDTIKVTVTIKVDQDFSLPAFKAENSEPTRITITVAGKPGN